MRQAAPPLATRASKPAGGRDSFAMDGVEV
jgi:hypothetical protein